MFAPWQVCIIFFSLRSSTDIAHSTWHLQSTRFLSGKRLHVLDTWFLVSCYMLPFLILFSVSFCDPTSGCWCEARGRCHLRNTRQLPQWRDGHSGFDVFDIEKLAKMNRPNIFLHSPFTMEKCWVCLAEFWGHVPSPGLGCWYGVPWAALTF